GRAEFGWDDLVGAMTTVESGTAVGVQYVEEETRAVAIHEAGHAAAAHVYRPQLESSRLSIRMRGGSLGHHQAFEKQERFSQWHSEAMGELVHTLGAMAAEHVFYGETSNGVGGDLEHATSRAAQTVGQAYVTAASFITANREAVQKIADAVVAKRELFGDELVELLESASLRRPEIDYLDEASWPRQ